MVGAGTNRARGLLEDRGLILAEIKYFRGGTRCKSLSSAGFQKGDGARGSWRIFAEKICDESTESRLGWGGGVTRCHLKQPFVLHHFPLNPVSVAKWVLRE